MNNEKIYQKLEAGAKTWADEQVKVTDRGLLCFYVLLALALAAPIFSLFVKPTAEPLGIWFQRSGAIMVVISLLAEMKVSDLIKIAIKQSHTFLYCHIFLKNKYERRLTICNLIAFLFISIGTIIWGYGDLVLGQFMS